MNTMRKIRNHFNSYLQNKMNHENKLAYFSMEVALDDAIPNYYGGLGILAGDILLSASDMERPIVGMSLIYHQDSDPKKAFHPEKYLKKLDKTVSVKN